MGKSLKYRVLQFSVFVLLILSVLFLLNACNKESLKIDSQPSLIQRNLSLGQSSKEKVLQKFHFDPEGNILLSETDSNLKIKHAKIEYQREMSNFLFEFGNYNYWDSINKEFGLPIWELSVLTETNEDNSYVVTVPFIKDDSLTSMMTYFTNGDRSKAVFISKNNIHEVLNTIDPNIQTINFWRLPLKIFQVYDFFISKNNNEQIINWINNADNKLIRYKNDKLTNRDWCVFMETIDYYTAYMVDGVIVWVSDEIDYTSYVYTIEWCEGPPPFINPGSTYTGDPRVFSPGQNCNFMVSDFMVNWMVTDFLENENLKDPCNPEMTTEQILRQLALKACQRGVDLENLENMDMFYKDLGEGGDLIIEEERFKNCKNVYCVWKDLKNLKNTYFCNLIKGIDLSKTKVVKLNLGPYGYGGRVEIVGNNLFELSINPAFCNSNDFLGIAETLVHELAHVDFKFRFNEVPDRDTYQKMWDEYVIKKFGIKLSEHNVMVKEFMGKIANTLMALDGYRYPYDHYMYLAWLSLELWNEGAFTEAQIKEWKNKYEIVKKDPKIYKCD